MTTKKPSDLARERLAKRAQEQLALVNKIVPKSLQKTPSQKRSEAGRKKYLKRAGVHEPEPPQDCFGCEKVCSREDLQHQHMRRARPWYTAASNAA